MTYYDRTPGAATDGSPTFGTAADTGNEDAARARLEAAWNCTLHHFGQLSPIDWYALRHGRMVALVEIKTRTHSVDKFPTVFLNLRKWLALMLGGVGHGVPIFFAVQWTDSLRWINVADIDARAIAMGGCSRVVKSRSDVEPVINVPVANMRAVA